MTSLIFGYLFLIGGTLLATFSKTDLDQLVTGIVLAGIGLLILIVKQIIKLQKSVKKEA